MGGRGIVLCAEMVRFGRRVGGLGRVRWGGRVERLDEAWGMVSVEVSVFGYWIA